MADTSGLQKHKLVRGLTLFPPNCLRSDDRVPHKLGGGCSHADDGRCPEPSGMHFFSATHEPGPIWPQCALSAFSRTLRFLASSNLQSLLKNSLRVILKSP